MDVDRAGHESQVSAWPEPPNAKSADARCGVQATFAAVGTRRLQLAPVSREACGSGGVCSIRRRSRHEEAPAMGGLRGASPSLLALGRENLAPRVTVSATGGQPMNSTATMSLNSEQRRHSASVRTEIG